MSHNYDKTRVVLVSAIAFSSDNYFPQKSTPNDRFEICGVILALLLSAHLISTGTFREEDGRRASFVLSFPHALFLKPMQQLSLTYVFRCTLAPPPNRLFPCGSVEGLSKGSKFTQT